ncbi:MAG: hypothetical protein NVSMB16_05270 [Acidimicrobiales bacterium]
MVIVDVLRFTTAVTVGVDRGVTIWPAPWKDPSGGAALAARHGAVVAGFREDGGLSLSPADLLRAEPGTRLVLPSPNGAACALAAAEEGAGVVAACLRNATAVADWAAAQPGRVGVVAAGELSHGGDRRLAWEDDLGAGAVLATLVALGLQAGPGVWPAVGEWAVVAHDPSVIHERLLHTPSAAELVERGWADDVALAAEHDVTSVVPVLREGAFVAL